MKILVCGGRDYKDAATVAKVLGEYPKITTLIHGGGSGADTLAELWAIDRCIPTWRFLANWKKYGPSAGPRRNAAMLAISCPDLVVAFHGGKGTADMMRKARAVDVPVHFYPQFGEVPT